MAMHGNTRLAPLCAGIFEHAVQTFGLNLAFHRFRASYQHANTGDLPSARCQRRRRIGNAPLVRRPMSTTCTASVVVQRLA
jgi:hypothetical protein